MRSTDLTREQLQATRTQLMPLVRKLARLRDRMFELGFPADDPLFVLAQDAFDAADRLAVDLHYRGCGSGVGREA